MKLFALAALLLSSASAFAVSNAVDAAIYFRDIAGEGFNVGYSSEGHPVVGVSIVEKSRGDILCQKATVLAPGAEPLFRCYQEALTGSSAKGTYEALEGAELNVSFSAGGVSLVGLITKQKNSERGFCRAKSAVIPRLVYSYACYVQIL